ncbi:hypothetical protein [Comamonas terrigena]|uniref:hypothetical protein n=1 Tax=Comamonas terrigena TaxID=32013 RepID=UPI002449582E|nr:hypothetical protein [Comamonas terrigena]MDH1701346.1 hypothetical protein [Comamonas terrigena]
MANVREITEPAILGQLFEILAVIDQADNKCDFEFRTFFILFQRRHISVDVLLKSLGMLNLVSQPMKAPSNVRSMMQLIFAVILAILFCRSIYFLKENFWQEMSGF